MSFCPQCGIKTHEDEKYCVSCGAELPTDLKEREKIDHGFNKWWLVPISAIIFFLLFSIGFHFYLSNLNTKAVEAYDQGVELALDGNYEGAKEKFNESLEYKKNFKASLTSLEFLDVADQIKDNLKSVDLLVEKESFQQALKLTSETENKLSQFDGEIVNKLLSTIIDKRNEVLIKQIESQLSEKPEIDELKMYLWRVESIKTDRAKTLAEQMKEQIVNYTFNSANEELKDNQFSLALSIVNDGLRYVPDNERLESLKTTIEKQKVAFETEQNERIQQALNQYEIEQNQNENNAIELISIKTEVSDKGLTVLGELKSVATVPIYSVSVKYSIYGEEDQLILENKTFLYPDTLYPEETGKFEYLHDDIDIDPENININIEQISWYLEGQ
ncbi:zinc ribbon domain-containing protein [Bacillaceae bacterium W0354]